MAEQETCTYLLKKFPDLANGVEWKTLGEIAIIKNGKDYKSLSKGKIPVYGSGGIMTYVDSYVYDKPTVLIPRKGSLKNIFYVDFPFWNVDTIFYTEIDNSKLYPKYLYYLLQKEHLENLNKAGGVPSLTQSVLNNLKIPLPPLSVQNEIVGILDKFTSLRNKLEKELELRKKQYEWTRQNLLEIKNAPFAQIKNVCKVEKGKTPIQKAVPGKYPLVVTTDERKTSETYQFDCKAACLSLVSARGHGVAQVSRIFYQEGKFALGNILCAIIPNDENQLSAKFLRHYLFYKKDSLLVPLMKGGANVSLHTSDVEKVKIPLPPLSEQNRIAEILDKFETLTSSQTQGILAEIALRQKQYEHYRDLLLSF